MSDSRILSVKPIIHYPRVAQVGKTYLMTIDLEVEAGAEWQYEEEEYPIYCTVDSELFSSKPVGEPVVVMHSFGGSYGEAKFLLTAAAEERQGDVKVALINAWGIVFKVLKIEQIVLSTLNESSDMNLEQINSVSITSEAGLFHSRNSAPKSSGLAQAESSGTESPMPRLDESRENETALTSEEILIDGRGKERIIIKTNKPIRRNPYIIGRPVGESDRFLGRESVFEFIKNMLSQGAPIILLYGQRRMGQSSILACIPERLQDEPYQFVSLPLDGKSQKSLAMVLYELARDICEDLDLPIRLPTEATLAAQPREFADQFLVDVQQQIQAIKGHDQKLVLIFGSVDTLGNYRPDVSATHLFPYLSEIIEQHKFLHIILMIECRLDDLSTLPQLFKQAPTFEIGLLNQRDTNALITQTAEDIMFYESDALNAIWELTTGHPYFTQVLCFALFTQAREDDQWQITAADVARAVDRAIELGEGGLAWFWDGLPIPERVFFAAAAEVAEIKLKESRSLEIKEGDPLALMEDSGIILTDCLYNAERNLLDWKYLCQSQRVEAPETEGRSSYKITIELVRRWLMRRHCIKQEIWELQDLEPTAKADYEAARELRQHRSFYPAIQRYEQVLVLNPNHISTIFELAECLLATQASSRTIAIFERAYQIDPYRAQDGLMRAHLDYAKLLFDRDQLIEAEQSLAAVEALDEQSDGAKRLRQMIQAKRQAPEWRGSSWGRFITDFRWNLLGGSPQPPDNQGESIDPDNTP